MLSRSTSSSSEPTGMLWTSVKALPMSSHGVSNSASSFLRFSFSLQDFRFGFLTDTGLRLTKEDFVSYAWFSCVARSVFYGCPNAANSTLTTSCRRVDAGLLCLSSLLYCVRQYCIRGCAVCRHLAHHVFLKKINKLGVRCSRAQACRNACS